MGSGNKQTAGLEAIRQRIHTDGSEEVVAGISDPKNDNGSLLANYVAKYFEDMWHISLKSARF